MKIVQKMMEKIAHPFAGCFLLVLQFAPLCAYGKRTDGSTGFSVDNIYYHYVSETEVSAQLWSGSEYNSTIIIPSTIVDKYVKYTGGETITETYEVIGVSLHNNTTIRTVIIHDGPVSAYFGNCTSLENVSFPVSVKSISFKDCTSLVSVTNPVQRDEHRGKGVRWV